MIPVLAAEMRRDYAKNVGMSVGIPDLDGSSGLDHEGAKRREALEARRARAPARLRDLRASRPSADFAPSWSEPLPMTRFRRKWRDSWRDFARVAAGRERQNSGECDTILPGHGAEAERLSDTIQGVARSHPLLRRQ